MTDKRTIQDDLRGFAYCFRSGSSLAERSADHIDKLEADLASAHDTEAALREAWQGAEARIKELEAQTQWQPIETAPKDGAIVDLWIVGENSMVDFYSPSAAKIKGKPYRHGRVCSVRWEKIGPNKANWYSVGGLGYPLSPEVTPTHWQPLPQPPAKDDV